MDNAIHFVEGLHTTVLWREGRFQVEMVTCAPGTKIPPHSHPNVDSFEVNLNGGVDFFIDGRRTIPLSVLNRRNGDHCQWYGLAVRVLPGVQHWAEFGPNGGTFLSVQHWPEGIPMTAVGFDWDGEMTMGDRHSSRIT